MKTKYLTRPLEVKSVGEDGTFEGYGSVFNVIDSYREIVLKGAFLDSIKEHEKAGSMPSLLWQHDATKPIGVWESMEEDEHGLKMRGRLALGTQQGKEAHELLKMNALKGLSIGFNVPEDGEEYDEEHRVWNLSKINLWETSVVTFPANQAAKVTDVRSEPDFTNPREFERQLRDVMNLSQSQAKRLMSGGYKALQREVDSCEVTEADKQFLSQLQW